MSWIKNIKLEEVFTSVDNKEFLAEVSPHFVSEELRFTKMLESLGSGDEDTSSVEVFSENFLDVLSGLLPVRTMFKLLISKVSQRSAKIHPSIENPEYVAKSLVMVLVSRAYKKSSIQEVPKDVKQDPSSAFSRSYHLIDAIMNCGVFTHTSNPEVFLHTMSKLGYRVKGYGDADGKS